MKDLLGLIFVIILLGGMGLLACLKVYRYNPDGDKCEHGVRGGEGFDCRLCTTYPEE